MALTKPYHKYPGKCDIDVDDAIDIFEEYKEENPEKIFAIDRLEEWIVYKAYDAPVINNIESFVYRMNIYVALCAEGTKMYQFFCDIRDTAEELAGKFL